MNKFENIPLEMREHKAWVLWKYVDKGKPKLDKIPYSVSNYQASPTNPNDWSDFDNVIRCYNVGGYDGIGFVFSKNDPYAFIDLDVKAGEQPSDIQQKILNEFDTYSELSPSGRGLHLIVKGSVSRDRNFGGVELYSNTHYATMTGNVFANKPIAERNDLLNQLYKQMDEKLNCNANLNVPDVVETQSDESILELAHKHNSEKFYPLSLAQWQGKYVSQSEADQAYMNIISYYTDNREQVKRIYCQSELAKTDAKRKTQAYLNRTVNTAFDQKLPTINIDGFKNALEEKLEQQRAEQQSKIDGNISYLNGHSTIDTNLDLTTKDVSPSGLRPAAHNSLIAGSIPATSTIQPPFGLMGDIARFIYDAAPRPVPEVAIAAAIGFMAGICGRAYNFNDTGLNLYIMCLAKTGRGKEAAASGIDKIINEVQKQVPVASEFIGPSEIASGQALVKYIANKSPCFVSILGEFGIRLQIMSDNRSNSAEKTLQKTLLELYQKSGHGQIMRSSIYADKDKNTNDTFSPAFSILAEGTPETVYEAADENMILSGLLPRFIILDYQGDRQLLNENRNVIPDGNLIRDIAHLMSNAKTLMANRTVKYVSLNSKAKALLKEYDEFTTSKINSKEEHKAIIELWNRAHIKCIKLASLVAIGININDPIVTENEFIWAKNIVESGINILSKKFSSGQVGKSSNELRQINEVKRIFVEFVKMKPEKLKSYQISEQLYNAKTIPLAFISRRLSNNIAFKNDPIPSASIHRAIKNLLDTDFIEEVPKDKARELGVKRQSLYMISNMSILDEMLDE